MSKEKSTTTEKQTVTVTNPDTDAKVIEKIITARVGLLLKAPFFGNLGTRLVVKNADTWLPTAATDGRNLYYNSEFVNSLSVRQTEFLICHEILHCVYDHMGRRGDRDAILFNIAADYCVNQDIVDQGIGEKITQVPILLDSKYKGMCAEEIYDLLYQNADKINISKLMESILDEHLDDSDSDGDSSGGDGEKDGSGRPRKLTSEERKQIRDEFKEAVLSAAQACGAGNLPGGVRRLLSDLTEPKMNWRELLRQQIESTIKTDYTWMKPSRRGWHMDACMPAQNVDSTIDICVAVDTSGSMSDAKLRDIISEVHGIMEMHANEFAVTLWCFDTQVHNCQSFRQDNLDDILTYKIAGGGGTSFNVNWEFMKDNEIEPKKLIFFTDGETGDGWGDETYCDTLFIIHSNPGLEAPYGISVEYEN